MKQNNGGEITTLRDLVNHAALVYGDKDAYRYKVRKEIVSKTFLDLKRDTEAFGRALHARGLGGRHVAVLGPSSYEWITAYLGTVMSGGVIVPLDKELAAADLCEEMDRADVECLVYDEMFEDTAFAAAANCGRLGTLVCMQGEEHGEKSLSFSKCLEENPGPPLETALDPDALCTLIFTSGTTGKPKGVMLSNRNIAHNVTCTDFGIDADAVTLSVLPFHHAYCFTCEILLGIYLGITVCINDSVMHLAKNLQLFQPTILVVVPMIAESMYRKMSEAAGILPKKVVAHKAFGGRLKTIFSGGAFLDQKLIDDYQKLGIDLIQGYGMSECSPLISTNYIHRSRAGSVGELVPGCACKVVDGEIWVKSDSVMLGYYKNEEATAETLQDGWLRTGDLGYLDDERFLFLTGRRKNLIILANGENVSPEELENRFAPFPLVKEVLVYDEEHVIAAEIFPDQEYAERKHIRDIPAQVQKAVDKINGDLPAYKKIARVKIRETEFEKTTSRKIKRQYAHH